MNTPAHLLLGLAAFSKAGQRKVTAAAAVGALLPDLCGAALLHIALDFPLHHDDGRAHFWPLSDWVYASPVSYWDSAHHAGWVAPFAAMAALASAVIVFRRHASWSLRVAVLALVAAEFWTIRGWLLFF